MPFSSLLGLGLGLGGPFLLNTLTAPAERIQLLLQNQDEVILNLRLESLALNRHRKQRHQHCRAPSSDQWQQIPKVDSQQQQSKGLLESNSKNNDNNDDEVQVENKEKEKEEDDIEPRSILVPHAHLPFTDMKDCLQRLVEKEGHWSLWRGYPLEVARFVLQAGIETTLQKKQFFNSWLDLRSWINLTTESFAGSATWILSAAIKGTLTSTLALVVVYPLATLQTKMATDVVRRTKKIKEPIAAAATGSHGQVEGATELIKHNDGQQQQEYTLSYKYRNARDALQTTLDSLKGYLGLYDGFSTVLVSTFVSRLGFIALYRMVVSSSGLLCLRSSRTSVGSFLFFFGATSIINLAVYPLNTVCHRRMIASTGRYSSSWDAAKCIVEKQGWRALYKGYEVVLVRSAVLVILSPFIY